jgi:hypothetical protein
VVVADYEEQSPEELAIHYGPGGPVAAVYEWVELIHAGDLRAAWPKTDPTLRLVLAQAWLWANRGHATVIPYDREEAAESLAGTRFDHDLWPAFEETQIGEFAEQWPDFPSDEWGAASRPRPVPPDSEVVMFMRTGGEVIQITEPTLMETFPFLMRLADGEWLVESFSSERPKPGWPPEAPRPSIIE